LAILFKTFLYLLNHVQFVAIFSMLTCMQGKKRMKKAKKQKSQNTSEARSSLYNSVHKQWLSFWSNL